MTGVYFSGTGNTKHCVELLCALLDPEMPVIPLEESGSRNKIAEAQEILLGYPVQFSNIPYFVRDYIRRNADLWAGKTVFCVATMGAFSGDGAGCAARLLQKYGAHVCGGLHLQMPDSVCDVKALKKSADQNRSLIQQADEKIRRTAAELKNGRYPQEGLSLFSHIAGLLGQRLWFYTRTSGHSDKLKIGSACTGCGRCAALCPMQNLIVRDGKAAGGDRCTMCYRCISSCPEQAITLLGRQVYEQCRFDRYKGGLKA